MKRLDNLWWEILTRLLGIKRRRKSAGQEEQVTTVLRAAFPKAPADLLELIQRRLSVDTLKEFRELNNHQIEEGIRQGCYRYSNRLIGKPESSTKTFLSLLRNYADSANISYDSLFSYRASSSLPGIIRELASGGKGQVKHIRQALD